jgi:hypothetical protein
LFTPTTWRGVIGVDFSRNLLLAFDCERNLERGAQHRFPVPVAPSANKRPTTAQKTVMAEKTVMKVGRSAQRTLLLL